MAETGQKGPGREPRTFRISAEGLRLLAALSAHLGVSQNAVIELAIRDKAKAEGIK